MSTLVRQPTIWMNVTTSFGWKRPPVGIIRVERALAAQLRALLGPERFKYCVWRDDRFVEWIEASCEPEPTHLGQALDLILPKTSSFDLARPYLMRALRKFGGLDLGTGKSPILNLTLPTNARSSLHPIRGDFVISAGLDWDTRYPERFFAMTREQGLRIITCCYDLIPVLFPQYCVGEVAKRFTEYFLQLCWGSEAVLCISKQTETDFTRLCTDLGAPVRRTMVIPLGDSVPGTGSEIGDDVRALSSKPFILFVSTIERRKNHEVLYRAYHLLARQGQAKELPLLVFVGMPGWGTGDMLKDIELDPLTKGLIRQLHHTSDSELNHLYRHASFCVYPSLYEGWGLPVGEALAMGKAVLSSAEGSLPEVGGDLVRYIDPWDARAWADAIWEWVQDPQKVRQIERKVRQNYKARQWSQTARVVKDVIEALPPSPDRFTLTLSPGHEMSTHAGVHMGPGIWASGAEGLLLFGPHWALASGRYEVHVHGSTSGKTAQRVVFEAASAAGQQVHGKEVVKLTGAKQQARIASFKFTLLRDVEDFEVRCLVEAGCTLHIECIELLADISIT